MAGITALLRAIYSGDGNETERRILTDRPGNLLMAGGMPPYVEMTRRGIGWQAMNTTALAALVVRPSTLANFTLFNNEPEGGLCYVIDRAFAFNLVSTTAQARHGLWLCQHPRGLASPTNDITARGSYACKANYGGRAVCDTNMVVTADDWAPWSEWGDVEPTGVLPGGILSVKLEGRLIIPPQCGVSTQVVSSVVGNTYTTGFGWYETRLDML